MFEAIGCGKEESITFYNAWVKHVKNIVPPNRLLVFEVKEGWEPLCKFLDLSVPEGPFPRVNDTQTMLRNFKKLRIVSYVTMWGIPILLATVAIVSAAIMLCFTDGNW